MRAIFAAIFLFVSTQAYAEQPASPPEQEHAERIFKHTPDVAGVWELQKEKGSLHHIQSGLLCPALYTKLQIGLWQLFNYPSPNGPGTDVGCDYGRTDDDGHATVKISVFAIKAGPDETLDSAFQRYRAELLQFNSTARSLGEFQMFNDTHPDPIAQRSEQFETTINNVPSLDVLTVSLLKGWIVEVRTTHRRDMTDPVFQAAPAIIWAVAVLNIKSANP